MEQTANSYVHTQVYRYVHIQPRNLSSAVWKKRTGREGERERL